MSEKIYVTGASGFIGRHVVAALRRRGRPVVALTRDPSRIAPEEGVEVRTLDLLDLDAVLPAIEDCVAGVHVAGAGADRSTKQLFDANVQASRHLAGSCRRKPALKRLVAFSSAAVLESGDTEYRRAKIGMEAAVLSYEIDWTLLRPTLVLGPPDESAEMAALVERVRAGTTPLPNGGKALIQPVHVDDVAEAAASAVLGTESVGAKLTLAGPEGGIAYRALLVGIRDRTGGTTRFTSIPLVALRLAALAGGIAGKGGRFRAAAAFHGRDHVSAIEDARRLVEFAPRDYQIALDDAFGPLAGG